MCGSYPHVYQGMPRTGDGFNAVQRYTSTVLNFSFHFFFFFCSTTTTTLCNQHTWPYMLPQLQHLLGLGNENFQRLPDYLCLKHSAPKYTQMRSETGSSKGGGNIHRLALIILIRGNALPQARAISVLSLTMETGIQVDAEFCFMLVRPATFNFREA